MASQQLENYSSRKETIKKVDGVIKPKHRQQQIAPRLVQYDSSCKEGVKKVNDNVKRKGKELAIRVIKPVPQINNAEKHITDTTSDNILQIEDECLILEYDTAETNKADLKDESLENNRVADETLISEDKSVGRAKLSNEETKFKDFQKEYDSTINSVKVAQTGYKATTSEFNSMETDKVVVKIVPNKVNITDTPSGNVGIKVENTFLDKLEKKLTENPDTHVYLRELNPGQLIVDFEPQENVTNLKMQVTKSPGGETQFVLFRNLSPIIQPCEFCDTVCEQATSIETLQLKVIRGDCKLRGDHPDSKRKTCYNVDKDTKWKENLQSPSAKKTVKLAREEMRNFVEDTLLNQIPNEINRGKIKLNVQGANGSFNYVETNVKRTLSGNITMDIKDMNCAGLIANSLTERPVLLKKSSSREYTLFVGGQAPEQPPNTILRRTASGDMLVVITEPVLRSIFPPMPSVEEYSQELYRVSVKGASSRVTALPAILKMTSSHNYVLVLDKEFEKQFNDRIINCMKDYSECNVQLQKIASDAIVINFDNNSNENTCHSKQNAILVKTLSNHLKIFVNGQVFNTLLENIVEEDSKKIYEQLLQKIDTLGIDNVSILSIPGSSNPKKKPKSLFKKQSSDSQLLEQKKSSILTNFDRPIKIQKTASGQYAVVLDRDSKKSFLTDLKNYLSINTNGRVPIKKDESGDIIIVLDTKEQSTDLYGSLKITPSGNVYVTMDENVLKALSNKPPGMTDLGSHHIIRKVKNPENKGVATDCNDHQDAYICSLSCTCKDLLECVDKKRTSQETKQGPSSIKSIRRHIPCNPDKCYASCCTRNRYSHDNVTMKPCECVNPSYSEQINIQQCYYMYDSVCRMNENTCANWLNELSDTSSLIDNEISSTDIVDNLTVDFNKRSKAIQQSNLNVNCELKSVDSSKYDWKYLPPQLPPFLRNF